MSNEQRNPYYKKKHPKNMSSLAAATLGTGTGGTQTNATSGTSSLTRAANMDVANEMNVSVDQGINAPLIDLNESPRFGRHSYRTYTSTSYKQYSYEQHHQQQNNKHNKRHHAF
jgi:hypothetical protein